MRTSLALRACLMAGALLAAASAPTSASAAARPGGPLRGAGRSRNFTVADDRFVLDGSPIQLVAGSIHYFRIHPDLWRDRLLRVRSVGQAGRRFVSGCRALRHGTPYLTHPFPPAATNQPGPWASTRCRRTFRGACTSRTRGSSSGTARPTLSALSRSQATSTCSCCSGPGPSFAPSSTLAACRGGWAPRGSRAAARCACARPTPTSCSTSSGGGARCCRASRRCSPTAAAPS
jgi:hypothetical protein